MTEFFSLRGAADRGRRRVDTGHGAALLCDTRGAVYVLGIVLGAVLFGVAWNLVNVGSAIAWRERAQDLADAAAYENALAHARGMNLLVMVNLLMVIVLSFLVIWRMLLMAMLALAIPTFGASLSVARLMSEQDRVLAATVQEFVQAGPYLQKVIALSTPPVAAQRAEALVREHYPVERLRAFASVSASLFPADLVARLAAAERAERSRFEAEGARVSSRSGEPPSDVASAASGALSPPSLAELNVAPARLLAGASDPVAGFGLGLPAEPDQWDNLCNTAAQAAVLRLGEGDFAVPGLDALSAGLRGWGLDRAMQSAPDPFCADWDGARDRAVSLATTACKTLGGGVAQRLCSRVARHAVSPFFGGASPAVAAGQRPALLKAPAHLVNGNGSAQSWSFVELDPEPWLGLSRQGLEVIDGERDAGGAAESAQRRVSAQFEMYFDCTRAWSRCADDSLLRLAWRARGRPVNPALASLLLGGALELGEGRLGQLAQGAGGDLKAQLQRWAQSALERALPEAAAIREQIAGYADPALQQRIAEQVRSVVAQRAVQGAAGAADRAPTLPEGAATEDGRPSALALAAARVLQGLSASPELLVH
jgi:hypothetical protein